MTVATIDANALISEIYQNESRRVFATLVRLLGDFDLAEDALQDAFARRSRSGRAMAYPIAHALGWFPPDVSSRSTASASAPGSTHRWPRLPATSTTGWKTSMSSTKLTELATTGSS